MKKSPKVYFYDTGIVCYLLSIDSENELSTHPLYGNIFENFVVSEKLKQIWGTRVNEKLFFWRDSNGVEIDLFVDKGLDKELIEIKSSQTYKTHMTKNIELVTPVISGKYRVKGMLVYQGQIEQSIQGIELVNWRNF